MIARTFRETTPVNSIVTLECQAHDPGDVSATVPIANITWTRDNTAMEDIHDSVIDVTSDVAADVTFSCFVTDVNGRNGTDDVVVAFKRGKESLNFVIEALLWTSNGLFSILYILNLFFHFLFLTWVGQLCFSNDDKLMA